MMAEKWTSISRAGTFGAVGLRSVLAVAAIFLAQPAEVWAAPVHRTARTSSHSGAGAPRTRHLAAPRSSRLADAKAALKALARDRNRRRFHHNWEKAIAGLLRAARGADRPAALYEAARARYALYRWSADESDRDEALKLAAEAGRSGAPEGKALAAAIRREAGDDRPAAPRRRGGAHPAAPAPPAQDEEESTDPALERVVSALAEAEEPAPQAESSTGPARVSEVKAWSSPDYTRVAVYLSRWVGWQKLELPADPSHPRRLALDLRPALLEGRTLEHPVGGLRLARVRAAQNGPDTVRVVLDLAGDDRVQVFQLDDPPRLVLDLGSPTPADAAPPAVASDAAPAQSGPEVAAEQAGSPPEDAADAGDSPAAVPAPRSTQAPAANGAGDTRVELPSRALAALERPAEPGLGSPPATPPGPGAEPDEEEERSTFAPGGDEVDQRPIRRIVVDAGHGGHDPGAIGPTHVREKDVTLAIAHRLARRLRDAGFEVVLTRKDDRYLPLEERTALANTAHGDLFVSVHANAHPRRVRAGIETYFLNVTDDRYAARLAARENGVDLSAAGDLARILTDLDARASAGASLKLARLVQREVCGGIRSRVGEVRDLGVKSALFYVLLGARMPAVLVETGFISNRAEERRLASPRYEDEVAAGIARAVSAFARSAPRVARGT
jgi:N-acetylmuramoyl-L-alanine amidase